MAGIAIRQRKTLWRWLLYATLLLCLVSAATAGSVNLLEPSAASAAELPSAVVNCRRVITAECFCMGTSGSFQSKSELAMYYSQSDSDVTFAAWAAETLQKPADFTLLGELLCKLSIARACCIITWIFDDEISRVCGDVSP